MDFHQFLNKKIFKEFFQHFQNLKTSYPAIQMYVTICINVKGFNHLSD